MSFFCSKFSLDVPWCPESDVGRLLHRTSYEEEELKNDSTRFTYFEACLYVAVLEDTLTQLNILEGCNNEMAISKVMSEMTILLAHKYGVKDQAVKDELDDIDPDNLHCLEYTLRKLQRDRDFIQQVLKETYLNLSIERNFGALTKYVNDIDNENKRLKNLIEGESKNKICLREAYRQLRQHRNHIKSATYDASTQIDRLNSYLEDSGIMTECRSRFISNWQRSLEEQQVEKLTNEETLPIQNIEYFKMKYSQEQCVHNEIELLINLKINEILEKVQEWMKKYDKDMEGIDLKIQLKKNEYDQTYDKRLDLEKMIKKHAELILSWNAFKEEREAVRCYREKMNNAAITVQSWWRGLLVRQQLGPYKVAKRKGKKK